MGLGVDSGVGVEGGLKGGSRPPGKREGHSREGADSWEGVDFGVGAYSRAGRGAELHPVDSKLDVNRGLSF